MDASGGSRWHTARLAASWLAHPVSIAALVVMVVNDHLLKQAYGSWWTGKLSDAAGLVFFPALVGLVVAFVAPRLGWRATVAVALGATATGFAWVKVTQGGAAAASDALSALAGPSLLRADATDLLALPFLALAAWAATRPPLAQKWRVIAVLPVAVLASAATSQDTSGPTGIVSVQSWGTGVATAESEITEQPSPALAEWWIADEAGGEFRPIAVGDSIPNMPGETLDCLAWDQVVCYRVYADHLGVERSVDGGETWTVDWEIPEDQRIELTKQRVGTGNYEETDLAYLETMEVAVVGNQDGYHVYAANGMDGVSVRNPDGTWERIGRPHSNAEWQPAQELP